MVRPGPEYGNFIVLFPGVAGYSGFTQEQAVLATFGQPGRTYHVGPARSLVWKTNLLRFTGEPAGTDDPAADPPSSEAARTPARTLWGSEIRFGV